MKVGAAAWKIRPIKEESDFWDHLSEFLDQAAELELDLLVLPEFITLELGGLFEDAHPFPQERSPVQAHRMVELQARCQAQDLTLVCGSAFAQNQDGKWINRSTVLGASGWISYQDKQILTQWESQEWGLVPGDPLSALSDPRLGVLVCYDSEFPELTMALAEKGALCLCVPSYTETWHGHWRIRHSCHARAIEAQIFVLHSCLLGSLGREPVPTAHGSAAVISPCLSGFPANGLLAETEPDTEGIAWAEVDFDQLLQSRSEGDVRNWDDRHKAKSRIAQAD